MTFRLFTELKSLPNDAKGSVVAIGNFDGVHRGHQQLLAVARKHADALETTASVLTFDPHPRWYFNPRQKPFCLSSMSLKAQYIAEHRADQMMVAQFDAALAGMSAQSFVEDLLARDLGVRHVVVGHDYRFGKRRQGGTELLRTLGMQHGFGVSVVAPFRDEYGLTCSSTRVREALSEGQPELAAQILGRNWEVLGSVERQENGVVMMELGACLHPAPGRYAVHIDVLDPQGGSPVDRFETLAWISASEFSGEDGLHIVCSTLIEEGATLVVQFLECVGMCGMYPSRHIAHPAVNIW